MKITFVNKNYLIPDIKEFSALEDSLDKLYETTFNQSAEYNENVYVVHNSKIYFHFNEKFYLLYTKTNNIAIHNYNSTNNINGLNIIKNFTNNNKSTDLTELTDSTDSTDSSEMKLVINSKTTKNININDTKEITKSNVKTVETPKPVKKDLTVEEEQIVKLCEEVMETYQKEKNKVKEIEKKIKVLDNQEKTIKKKIQDKMYTALSKLKGDYHTYKLINLKDKKTKDSSEKHEIPVLFTRKYAHFKNLISDSENLELLEQVDKFILDNIINNEIQIDNKIINLAKSYEIISKDLNVKFDHSWEELDADDGTDNNRSLFG